MKMVIVNGIPNNEYAAYETALASAKDTLAKKHTVDMYTVRDLNINYCIGCFNCWLKTPGYCVFKDDTRAILKSIVHADMLLYVSPVKTGFVTKEIKKVADRMIPLLQPYIQLVDNECHHVPRYDMHFRMGLLLIQPEQIDSEVQSIIKEWIDRFSLNIYTDRPLVRQVGADKIEEVLIHEAGCY